MPYYIFIIRSRIHNGFDTQVRYTDSIHNEKRQEKRGGKIKKNGKVISLGNSCLPQRIDHFLRHDET